MILYITVMVVTLLLASRIEHVECEKDQWMQAKSRRWIINRIMLAGIFAVLFFVSVFRIKTGNDYLTYIEHFHDVYCGNYVVTEIGFNIIVKAVYSLFDSEVYLLIFGIFALGTILFSLDAMYKASKDFAFTFFLYMSLGLYFHSLNTVRYYLALSIVMMALYKLVKDDYVGFIICVLVASLFHKSVLVVLPLYMLAKINWKKWQLVLFGAFSLTGLIFSKQYLSLMLRLYPSYVNEPEYLIQGSFSIINILRSILVITLAIICYEDSIKDNAENRFYLYLNVGALALYTCFTFVPFVSRIGYYLNVSQIFMVPAVINSIKDTKKRRTIRMITIAIAIAYFAVFLYKAYGETVKILPYSSWLYTAL